MKTISQVRKPIASRSRIAVLIHESGIGIRELASFSGVSPATVSRVESGKAPDIRTAFRLARFFETTIEDLFNEYAR